MDTPIYAELQQKLIDPEATNWGPSEPPEFAAELTEHAEQAQKQSEETATASRKRSRGGRRHRAEE